VTGSGRRGAWFWLGARAAAAGLGDGGGTALRDRAAARWATLSRPPQALFVSPTTPDPPDQGGRSWHGFGQRVGPSFDLSRRPSHSGAFSGWSCLKLLQLCQSLGGVRTFLFGSSMFWRRIYSALFGGDLWCTCLLCEIGLCLGLDRSY